MIISISIRLPNIAHALGRIMAKSFAIALALTGITESKLSSAMERMQPQETLDLPIDSYIVDQHRISEKAQAEAATA